MRVNSRSPPLILRSSGREVSTSVRFSLSLFSLSLFSPSLLLRSSFSLYSIRRKLGSPHPTSVHLLVLRLRPISLSRFVYKCIPIQYIHLALC